MIESAIQFKCIDHLTKKGYLVMKLIKTNMNGIADLQVFTGNGNTFFIEVKQEKWKESAIQEYRRKEFIDRGYKWIVCYWYEDYLDKIQELI